MKRFTADDAARLNRCDRYISVTILRPAGMADCSRNGMSARHDRLFVPHPEGPFRRGELDPDQLLEVMPPVNVPDCGPRFKPRGEKRWCSMGGNYAESCDGRFRREYGGPAMILDRLEEN